MPLIRKFHSLPELQIAIWQLEEEEEYFLDRLELDQKEQAHLSKIKGNRRLEWLGGRWLMHLLTGAEKRIHCYIDEFGKPHLDQEGLEVSISHSHGLVAVAISSLDCGIDIQKVVTKIHRIEHKFMKPEESSALDPDHRMHHLHVYWGAKEALYKAYGRKQLDFKQHLHLKAFTYAEDATFDAWIEKNSFRQDFVSRYHCIQSDFILVAVQEKN